MEKDGSAWFRAPAGVTLFFQALDAEGAGRADHAQRDLRPAGRNHLLHRLPRAADQSPPPPPSRWPPAASRRRSLPAWKAPGRWITRCWCSRCSDKHCLSLPPAGRQGAVLRPDGGKVLRHAARLRQPSLRQHVESRYREARSIAEPRRGGHQCPLAAAGARPLRRATGPREPLLRSGIAARQTNAAPQLAKNRPQQEPDIQVHIGRIEVIAAASQPPRCRRQGRTAQPAWPIIWPVGTDGPDE